MFLSVSYSTCVVYTKTIIHLSVGESGGYYFFLISVFCNQPHQLTAKISRREVFLEEMDCTGWTRMEEAIQMHFKPTVT